MRRAELGRQGCQQLTNGILIAAKIENGAQARARCVEGESGWRRGFSLKCRAA
jgi:hypothetical protein